jgi:ribonuclease HI
VQTITEWAEGWKRRGWKRKTGPVENLDLVQQAYEAYRRRPELRLEWIKAHAGFRWNEYADELANRGRVER